ADGDVLIVRAGTYSGLVTSKGIAVLGAPGATLQPSGGYAVSVQVSSLPAGRTFSLRGFRLLAPTGFKLYTCSGTIVIDDVDDAGGRSYISGCASVSISRWRSYNNVVEHSIGMDTSKLILSSSSLVGADALQLMLGLVRPGTSALSCSTSEVWVV